MVSYTYSSVGPDGTTRASLVGRFLELPVHRDEDGGYRGTFRRERAALCSHTVRSCSVGQPHAIGMEGSRRPSPSYSLGFRVPHLSCLSCPYRHRRSAPYPGGRVPGPLATFLSQRRSCRVDRAGVPVPALHLGLYSAGRNPSALVASFLSLTRKGSQGASRAAAPSQHFTKRDPRRATSRTSQTGRARECAIQSRT